MKNEQLRGVNLGGWLVLEKWITPSLFEGMKAEDEHSWCLEVGRGKKGKLKAHRDTFITEDDFKRISSLGLNAVRLPVSHGIFGHYKPFVESVEYVENALDWAEKYELKVLLDLHTAPGSQNGEMHSGKAGDIHWHLDSSNIDFTVELIGKIAEKFAASSSLYGLELLNEPSSTIPLSVLQDFYKRAHDEARKYLPDSTKIIVSDAYRPIAEWEDFIISPDLQNTLLDVHLYQVFGDQNKKLSFDGHIAKTFKWQNMLEQFGPDKVVVGEWSAALDGTYEAMDQSSAAAAKYFFIQAQQYAFRSCAGYFYWNYKTEAKDAWNYL